MFATDLRMIATTDENNDSMEAHSLTTDLDFSDYTTISQMELNSAIDCVHVESDASEIVSLHDGSGAKKSQILQESKSLCGALLVSDLASYLVI